MEFIVTLLCLLVFVFGVFLIDLKIKVDRIIRKVDMLIDIINIKKKMDLIEERIDLLGGGAPNPPTEPEPDDDDD